jgi:hypothetical protein
MRRECLHEGLRRGLTRRSDPSKAPRRTFRSGSLRIQNPRQVVVEFYLALERATGSGSVDKARAAARAVGCTFTNSESSEWLKPFTKTAGITAGKRLKNGVSNGVVIEHGTAGHSAANLGGHNGLTHDNCIPGLIPESSVLRTSSSGVALQQPAAKPEKAKREPRNRVLPFDRPVLDLRNAILRSVWEKVQPLVARSTTWTDWRKRNSVIAASLAQGGFSAEQIVYAWEQCRTRDGDPVRELFMVQKWLERVQMARRKETVQA